MGLIKKIKGWSRRKKIIVSAILLTAIGVTLYYCVPRVMSDAEMEKYATEYSQKIFDVELQANIYDNRAQELERTLANITSEEEKTIVEDSVKTLKTTARGFRARYAKYHEEYNEVGARLVEKCKDTLRERFNRKYNALLAEAKAKGEWVEFIQDAKAGDKDYYATTEVTLSPEQEAALQAKVDEFAKRYNEAKKAGNDAKASEIAMEMTSYAEQYEGPEQDKYYELITPYIQEM